MKTISARQADANFRSVLGHVARRKEPVLVEEGGKAAAVVIDFDQYQSLIAKRNRAFAAIDRIWKKNRSQSTRRAYRDAAEAVKEVRSSSPSRRRVGA
jgi:PHD/YefM family antitoxin component YafN of YafNO toxin-antitoxin module